MYFEFIDNVRIYFGEGSVEKVGEYFSRIGSERPLLISGPVINKVGLVDIVTKDLSKSGVKIKAIYIDVPKDSSVEVVEELVDIYVNNNCDSLIALGGGSVIDTAKGVKLLLESEKSSLFDMQGIDNLKAGKGIPFAILPTTSGTGSEATKVAVISDTQNHVKHEFISERLLPDVTAIDPRLTLTLPVRATVSTAFDMLTHAIEAFTSAQKNPISDAFALKAMELFKENFFIAVSDTGNKKARQGMAEASLLAGIAFSNSMVGLAHAIGHSLGGAYGISHDVAMMILLPEVMRFNLDALDKEYATALYHIAGSDLYAETPPERRGAMAIKFIADIIAEYSANYGIALKLKDHGISASDIEKIADGAMRDGAGLANKKRVRSVDVIAVLKAVM